MKMENRGGRAKRGEPLRFIHEVALLHTGNECLTWPFSKLGKGYGGIWIDGKLAIVSRYVCELVHGAPPTPEHEACHRCGKGHLGCVSPGHLDWKTKAENAADRIVHGTSNRGERQGQSKLIESAVREIIALNGKETQRETAARFGVSRATVSDIHAGRTWAWLSKEIAA